MMNALRAPVLLTDAATTLTEAAHAGRIIVLPDYQTTRICYITYTKCRYGIQIHLRWC